MGGERMMGRRRIYIFFYTGCQMNLYDFEEILTWRREKCSSRGLFLTREEALLVRGSPLLNFVFGHIIFLKNHISA
jgi:hypothetical protein